MAVVALTSARGAPGVTTAALALALTWPRPVILVEADVSGSSSILAGYLRGTISHDRSLIDLAMAERRGRLAEDLHQSTIELPGSQARLLASLTSPAQAATMQRAWDPIATVLRNLDRAATDVIIDAGRLGTAFGPDQLLRAADSVLLVTRTSLPAIAAARARAGLLKDDLTASADSLNLLLVGEGQPYASKEISAAVNLPVAAALAWDPVNAEVLSIGAQPGRRFATSSLMRSVQAASSSIQALIAARRARLNPDAQYAQEGHR
jgi:hypothetical protein